MSPFPDELRLRDPPDNQSIESWLAEYDSSPRILPRWPKSGQMTLVVVRADRMDKLPPRAYVVVSQEQVQAIVEFSTLGLFELGPRFLFFRIPRHAVLTSVVCPAGLTDASWA